MITIMIKYEYVLELVTSSYELVFGELAMSLQNQ